MSVERTIRLIPTNVSPHGWVSGLRWHVAPDDPANGDAANWLAAHGYDPLIHPDDFGGLVLDMAKYSVRLIFDPLSTD